MLKCIFYVLESYIMLLDRPRTLVQCIEILYCRERNIGNMLF